jgi:hypothetical protein
MLRRFERHITSKASPTIWYRADYAIERDVGEHARDDMPGTPPQTSRTCW